MTTIISVRQHILLLRGKQMKSKWDKVNCRYCDSYKLCRKNSVSKGSAFCEMQRGIISDQRASVIGRIKSYWYYLLNNKRRNR